MLIGIFLLLIVIKIKQNMILDKCMKPDDSKITRFEVIDEKGRAYTNNNCKIELSYQDDNRTLKVFIKNDN